MLSGVLHSPRAVAVNIAIMRAFVRLRQALAAPGGLSGRVARMEDELKALELEQGEQAAAIHEAFAAMRRE